MKRFVEILMKFLFGVAGIVFVSATPALFSGDSFVDLRSYAAALQQVFTAFATPAAWTLNYLNPSTFETVPVSFEKFLSGPYLYSMAVLLAALVLAFIAAFIVAFAVLLSDGFFKRVMLQVVKILQSFPDFAYIFLIQITVIALFQKTGVLLLSFYSLGGEQIYLAPIACLSVVPAILFFKLFVLLYEEQQQHPYVELARSKGLSRFEVLWKHCTSNVLRGTFHQSKSIVWLTLSALLIIEYLFGMEGILYYLRNDFTPQGIAFILLSIFVPFFLFYSVVELLLSKHDVERNAVFEKFTLRLFDAREMRAAMRSLRSPNKLKTARSSPWRKPKIFLPVMAISGIAIASVLYSVFTGDRIDQIDYLYNADGSIASAAPHSPSAQAIFGTDPYGYSIAQQLLVGVKYTIILTFLIASLRIAFGYLAGIFYTFFFNGSARRFVNSMADGMHFLPLTLVTYILLLPVLISFGEWNTSLAERLVFQGLIMSLVVLPITASAIGNEMNETLKKEHVLSSVLMGGSLSWILAKHIQPELGPKLLLMWTQHMIQVLQMFVHLGILNIFVGGAVAQSDSPRLVPEIYELSGMIAISREVFVTNQYWMIIPPLVVFMILIYCFSTLAEALAEKELPTAAAQQTETTAGDGKHFTPSFTRIHPAHIKEDSN